MVKIRAYYSEVVRWEDQTGLDQLEEVDVLLECVTYQYASHDVETVFPSPIQLRELNSSQLGFRFSCRP
jgi:hypothetical protein